ncbi:MAG: diacylglycerol kinase family lipid kinase [Bacteroidetes bacterium]|nr:diacylglycerol kinase family lipid kinase [Bacteroidota bacterium]
MPPDKKIRFIINPQSGTTRKEKLRKLIPSVIDHSSYEIDIHYTGKQGHAEELSRQAVREKYFMVAVCGGDGTINEAGRALSGTPTALGIIPGGSGNGLARHLRVPLNFRKALRVINHAKITAIDTFNLNGRIVVNVAGIGFDAYIAWLFPKKKKRGFRSYANLVLREFYRYKAAGYMLESEEKKFSGEAFFITVANGSQFGSGTKIAPRARLNDGLMDVCIFRKFPMRLSPLLIARMFFNTVDRSKFYHSFRTQELILKPGITGYKHFKYLPRELHHKLLVHLDGEPVILHENEIRVKIRPHSLRVVVP